MTDVPRSLTPQYEFAATLVEQEAQLAANPLIKRFAAAREAFAGDRYRPRYHFINPESGINDPNGFCRWQGRWHLFYQAYPAEYLPAPEDAGKMHGWWAPAHWGHAVSDDLVHWRDLPYALYPGPEEMVFSGSIATDDARAVAFYPGVGAGQMVAVSDDPLLLNWTKHGPVDGVTNGDSDIWKEGDTYVGLIGGGRVLEKYYPESGVPSADPGTMWDDLTWSGFGIGVWPRFPLWTSTDLVTWTPHGDLMPENTPFTDRYDEGSCPVFEPIGDKHILFTFSHKNGGQYLLGDYEPGARTFRPYDHGRFNHGQVQPGGVHAPQAAPDGDGGVIVIHNVNEGVENVAWGGFMSLPQRLTLGADQRVRIAPVEALSSLRGERTSVSGTIPVDREWVLDDIRGDVLELDLEVDTRDARWVEIVVLRSPDGEERTPLTFYSRGSGTRAIVDGLLDEEIVLDTSRSSSRPDVWPRPPERAIVRRGGENLRIRVFVDRSIVEVFVNDRQYVAARVYPGRDDSVGVSLRAHGSVATLERLDAWRLDSIWP